MKRTVIRHPEGPVFTVAWSEAQYAEVWFKGADKFDDRVSESIFDIEDERLEVDAITHQFIHGEDAE
jgi:hypothetical protein